MNYLPMLACGPGPEFLILILAIYGGGAIALLSLILGAILLFWGNRGLGLTMISLSVFLGTALLMWFRIV